VAGAPMSARPKNWLTVISIGAIVLAAVLGLVGWLQQRRRRRAGPDQLNCSARTCRRADSNFTHKEGKSVWLRETQSCPAHAA
jgi:hypothetical protein